MVCYGILSAYMQFLLNLTAPSLIKDKGLSSIAYNSNGQQVISLNIYLL